MPLLDLSGADTSGFDAMPSGTYEAEVFEVTMDAVKNESGEGKLPPGTPMIKVQFKITGKGSESGEDYEFNNRRAFTNYIIPPPKYDTAKAAKMKGMLVKFFQALGFSDEVLAGKDFDPDLNELKGMPIAIVLGQKPKYNGAEGEMDNVVRSVRPAGAGAVVAGGLL